MYVECRKRVGDSKRAISYIIIPAKTNNCHILTVIRIMWTKSDLTELFLEIFFIFFLGRKS